MKSSMKIVAVGLLIAAVSSIGCAAGDKNGDAAAPRVETTLAEPAIEAKLATMRQLDKEDKQKELIEQFKDEDIGAWMAVFDKDKANADELVGAALDIRGRAYSSVKDYVAAEKDLALSVEICPSNGYWWNDLGDVCRRLKQSDRAVDAYVKAVAMDRADNGGQKMYGWMPLSATLNAAEILLSQTKYPEALKVMEAWNDEDVQKMSPVWGAKIVRMYGQVYAAMGREEEALVKFKAALEVERKR